MCPAAGGSAGAGVHPVPSVVITRPNVCRTVYNSKHYAKTKLIYLKIDLLNELSRELYLFKLIVLQRLLLHDILMHVHTGH